MSHRPPLGSAHSEEIAAREEGRFDGVVMSIRALREKAAAERGEGRADGYLLASADYLQASLEATVAGQG